MDFFNKLGKKANEAYKVTKEKATEAYKVTKEKASDISEEIKLKSKINSLEEKNYEMYAEIGEIVYNEVKDGKDVSKDEVTAKCEEISRNKDEIEKLKTDLLAIKKIKKCANCGEELDITVEFCSKCGKEQPKIEKIEIKEEPQAEVKEAEVVEVNNVEENSTANNESNNEEKTDENKEDNN